MVGVAVCGFLIAGALFTAAPALAASPLGPSALTASSSSLDFFSQDMHNPSPSLTETYTNNSVTPTAVQPATILGPDASSYSISQDSCSGQTIQITNSCSVSVVFYALPSGPGPKNATLELMDDNGINTGTTDVTLSGTAITGTLSADQSSLDFGGLVVNQGNSNQQHVTISNGPIANVSINNVQIIGPDASSFNIQNNNCQNQGTFGRNNTCQVYIQFQPNSAGTQNAQLEINNDGTANPLFVSLTGEGLNGPIVTVSPSQAIYGNVTLGSQSSQTFTLTDTGDAPLQIQGMFLAAGSPQVFPISNNSCSGRQISAGSSCQVTVGFIPIALGGKDASLFLISNASNPGVTTIGLSGTGVAPQAVSSVTTSTSPTKPTRKNGLVELVTCNTITKTIAKRVHTKREKIKRENVKISSQICTTQTVTGPRKVTTAPLAQAELSRGGVVYATGTAARDATHPKLALNVSRTLRAGSYTLTLRWTTARTTHTTHQTITLR
jgi:hypothetical protein